MNTLICEKYATRDSSNPTLFAFQKVRQKGTGEMNFLNELKWRWQWQKKKAALTVRQTGMLALGFRFITCNCNCWASARNVIFELIPMRVIY